MHTEKSTMLKNQAQNRFLEFLKAAWVIMIKDLQVWLRQPVILVATFAPPLVFLLVQFLGAESVGRSPVALVVQDRGPEALRSPRPSGAPTCSACRTWMRPGVRPC